MSRTEIADPLMTADEAEEQHIMNENGAHASLRNGAENRKLEHIERTQEKKPTKTQPTNRPKKSAELQRSQPNNPQPPLATLAKGAGETWAPKCGTG